MKGRIIMKNLKKMLCLLMALVLTVSLCACLQRTDAPGGNVGSENSGEQNVQDGGLTGTITVGYTADFAELYDLLIAGFRKMYPGVTVIPQEIPGTMLGQIDQMMALAGSGKMPDVCVGSEHFGTILQEGWAYPLDNLIAEDPDKEYIMDQALINFTYSGHVYALPYQMHPDSA